MEPEFLLSSHGHRSSCPSLPLVRLIKLHYLLVADGWLLVAIVESWTPDIQGGVMGDAGPSQIRLALNLT